MGQALASAAPMSGPTASRIEFSTGSMQLRQAPSPRGSLSPHILETVCGLALPLSFRAASLQEQEQATTFKDTILGIEMRTQHSTTQYNSPPTLQLIMLHNSVLGAGGGWGTITCCIGSELGRLGSGRPSSSWALPNSVLHTVYNVFPQPPVSQTDWR